MKDTSSMLDLSGENLIRHCQLMKLLLLRPVHWQCDDMEVIRNLERFGFYLIDMEDCGKWGWNRLKFIGQTGRTVTATYDGGGAWVFIYETPWGLQQTIRENDYQSITRYFRTGEKNAVGEFNGVKPAGRWTIVSLCGS